jgi:hypothetical protein
MHLPFVAQHKENGVDGVYRQFWAGTAAPDGDALPWSSEVPGSVYLQYTSTTGMHLWEKRKHDKLDNDWGPLSGVHCISKTVAYSAFTDGGSTTGTYVLTPTIPVGAYYYKTLLQDVTGFAGNVSATIQIGDGSDVDRYTTGTPSVFTTDTSVDVGVPSGTAYHDAAATITITVTTNSDFTAVTAGSLTVKMFYFN